MMHVHVLGIIRNNKFIQINIVKIKGDKTFQKKPIDITINYLYQEKKYIKFRCYYDHQKTKRVSKKGFYFIFLTEANVKLYSAVMVI